MGWRSGERGRIRRRSHGRRRWKRSARIFSPGHQDPFFKKYYDPSCIEKTNILLVFTFHFVTRSHAHRLQDGSLSGAKHPCTSPTAGGRFISKRSTRVHARAPAASRFTFGHETPVCIHTGRRSVYFRARSARFYADWPQAKQNGWW